jgi:Flp pilus assembly protein TadD
MTSSVADVTASDYSRRGEALMESGRLDEARAVLLEGHERYPDDGEICLHLGWVLYREHDAAEAHSFARRALDLERTDPWVTLGTGWLLYYLGDQELVGSALRLTKANVTPEQPHIITKMGVLASKVAWQRGRYDLAEAALRELQAHQLEDAEAGLELFALLQNLGREAEARVQIESLLRRAPEDEHLLELERATRPSS